MSRLLKGAFPTVCLAIVIFNLSGFSPAALGSRPLITEFLAVNDSGLRDDQGEVSDWIELHNPTESSIPLEGYALTDDEDDLSKWRFPKVTLSPGAYLLVFASGSDVPPPDPRHDLLRRLREVGLPEQFIDRVEPEQLEEFLQRLERQPRRVRLPRRPAPALHANFKLSGDGEYLALVAPDGETICHEFKPRYPRQVADVSYGLIGGVGDDPSERVDSSAPVGRLMSPTPGSANRGPLQGIAASVRFSRRAGYCEEGFALQLDTSTPDAEIRYTLNGEVPTASSGMVYDEALLIEGTAILRAAVFREGYKPSPVETRTYLFLNDVIRQSPNGESPPGWPRNFVNGQMLDYGMDPSIVEVEHTPEEVVAALEALPSMSVVTPLANLFDPRTGIYVNAGGRGKAWERAASLELLPNDESRGFQVDGGLRVRGGFSRQGSNPKHGFRFIFRKEYGDGKLKFPLFGDEGAAAFDKIDLRSSMNYSWAMGGGRANTLLRDVWSRDTQRDMGQPYTRSRFYHLYVNGHYWGIYMTQERSEAAYGETYLGGDREDYDTVKTFGEVTDGNGDARGRLHRAAVEGFESDEAYFRVQGMDPDGTRNANFERLVDVDNVIDYMLITFYTGDKDGPGGTFSTGNNYFSIYNRENPDGFKFFEHDSEHSLGLGMEDMTGSFLGDEPRRRGTMVSERQFNVHWLHTRLVANARYRQRFTERTEMHLFDGGALTLERALARLEAREKEIDHAIIAHAARWGDTQSQAPRTRRDWQAAVMEIKDFMATRNEELLRQLHSRGWYLGLPAPRLSRPSGEVARGADCHVLAGEGTVYVTLDGSDPRGDDGLPAASARAVGIPQIDRYPLLVSPSPARAIVPQDGALGNDWLLLDFDDRNWHVGQTGVGYDAKSDYAHLIGIDLEAWMHQKATTAYIRVPFECDPELAARSFHELRLRMRYDDGFVAYMNGKRVVSEHAPSNLDWASSATADHADANAVQFAEFPFDHSPGVLNAGKNLLAIQGMDGDASSDFIITPEIVGIRYRGAEPIKLDGQGAGVTVTARCLRDGKWSPSTRYAYTFTEAE